MHVALNLQTLCVLEEMGLKQVVCINIQLSYRYFLFQKLKVKYCDTNDKKHLKHVILTV